MVTVLLAPVLPFDSTAHLALRVTGVCLLTAVAVLLLGWIEGFAARGTPALSGPGAAGPPPRRPAPDPTAGTTGQGSGVRPAVRPTLK